MLFALHDRLWELIRRSRTHKAKMPPGLTEVALLVLPALLKSVCTHCIDKIMIRKGGGCAAQAASSSRKRASNENARPSAAKRQRAETGAAVGGAPAEAGDARMPYMSARCLAGLLTLIVDDRLPGCPQVQQRPDVPGPCSAFSVSCDIAQSKHSRL